MKDQPVIRIKCESGEKTFYPNIASAARDAKISPPGSSGIDSSSHSTGIITIGICKSNLIYG
jgi:hypothetical protein